MTPEEQLLVEAARRGLIGGSVVPLDSIMDRSRGAPAAARGAVGAGRSPDARLATLRKWYPDAQPYGEDNFVFTDPQTSRPTLYNPAGLDAGDLASIGPEISEMAGGIVGGALAVPAAVGGAVPTGGASLMTIPAGVGFGAAAGREIYDIGAQNLLGTVDPRSLPRRLTDAAVTAAANAVGQRAGDVAMDAAGRVVGAATRPFRNRLAGPGPQALNDAANVGVTPMAGAMTGNRGLQMIEQGLSNTPGGASVIREAAERAASELSQATDNLAGEFASGAGTNAGGRAVSKEAAGETLQGAGQAAGQRFEDRVGQLGDQLYNAVGADRRVPGQGVRAAQRFFADRIIADPGLARVYGPVMGPLDDILEGAQQNGGVSFQALHRLRQEVGRAMKAPDASNYRGADGSDLERVYAALTQDMQQAADAAGPAARRALNVHDRYIRFNQNANMPTLNALARTDTGASAYQWAMGGARDGGQRLRTLRRNVQPEEWDTVAGSVLRQMGQATPGQQGATDLGQEVGEFSVNSFLTNWNKMSPEAKTALFGGSRYENLIPSLNALVRTTGRFKDAEKMANPSGTARNIIAAGGAITAGQQLWEGDPQGAGGALVGTLLAPRAVAKLITSPSFVRWAAQAGNIAAQNPNRLSSHMARLVGIAKAEPEIRDAIQSYFDALRGTPDLTGQATETPPLQ